MNRKPGDIVIANSDELEKINEARNIFIDAIHLNNMNPTMIVPAMISIITLICKKNGLDEKKSIEIFQSNFREFYPVV